MPPWQLPPLLKILLPKLTKPCQCSGNLNDPLTTLLTVRNHTSKFSQAAQLLMASITVESALLVSTMTPPAECTHWVAKQPIPLREYCLALPCTGCVPMTVPLQSSSFTASPCCKPRETLVKRNFQFMVYKCPSLNNRLPKNC